MGFLLFVVLEVFLRMSCGFACFSFFLVCNGPFLHSLQKSTLVALISKGTMEKSLVFARTSKNLCWEHSSSCPTLRKKTGQFYFKPCSMELSDPEFSLPKHIHAIWMVGMLNRCGHTGIGSREHKKANIYSRSIYCKLNPTNKHCRDTCKGIGLKFCPL